MPSFQSLLRPVLCACALLPAVTCQADRTTDFKRAFLKDCASGSELFTRLSAPEQELLLPFLTGALNVRTRPPPEPLQPISTTPPLGGGPTSAWRSLPSDTELQTRRCAAGIIRGLGLRAVSASHDLFAAAMTSEPLPVETRAFLDRTLLEILGGANKDAIDSITLSRLIDELRGDDPALAVAALGSLPSELVVPALLEAFVGCEPEEEEAIQSTLRLHEVGGHYVSQLIRERYDTLLPTTQHRHLLLLDRVGARAVQLALAARSMSSNDDDLSTFAHSLWERATASPAGFVFCDTTPVVCDESASEAFSSLWGRYQAEPSEREFTFKALMEITEVLPGADEKIALIAQNVSEVPLRTVLLKLLGTRPYSTTAAWELVRAAAVSNHSELRETALAVLPKSTASSVEVLPLFRDLLRSAPDPEHPAQRQHFFGSLLKGTAPFLVAAHSKVLLPLVEELVMSEVDSPAAHRERDDILAAVVRSIGASALPAIRNALRSRVPAAQRRALFLLQELPLQGRIVTDVAPFLSSTDERMRDLAVAALTRPEIVTAPALLSIFPRLRADTQEALALAMAPYYPNQPAVLSVAQTAVTHLRCGALRTAFRALRRLPGAPLEQLERRALHCIAEAPLEQERQEAAEALADLPLSSPQSYVRLHQILQNILDGRERLALYRPFIVAHLAVDTGALVSLLDRQDSEVIDALELLSLSGAIDRSLSPQLGAIVRSDALFAARCLALNELVRVQGDNTTALLEPLSSAIVDLGKPCASTLSAETLVALAQTLAQRDDEERLNLLLLLAHAKNSTDAIAPFVLPYRASTTPGVAGAAVLALAKVAEEPTTFHEELREMLLSRTPTPLNSPVLRSTRLGELFAELASHDPHPLVRRRAALAVAVANESTR